MERAAVGEHEIQGGESSVFLDCQVAHCRGRLRNRVVIAAPQPFEEEFEYQPGVDFPSVSKVVHERPVVLECPSHPVPLHDERMGELLGHEPADTRAPQVAPDDERLPCRALDVGLRNFPGGPIILRCVRRAAGTVRWYREHEAWWKATKSGLFQECHSMQYRGLGEKSSP